MAFKPVDRLAPLVTYLFIIGFGIGSWVAVNGLWAELPILTEISPDSSYLQSILNVSFQLANVGPASFLLLDLIIFKIWNKRKFNPDSFLNLSICLVIITGIVSSICLSIWYDSTSVIGGQEHSVGLIVLAFMLALVDCTSTVTFIPFMKSFSSVKFMTALYVGEGLSGVLPSIFALAQGINIPSSAHTNLSNSSVDSHNSTTSTHTNFSPQVYFLLLAAMMAFCGFSFGMLQLLPWVQKSKKPISEEKLTASATINDSGRYEPNEPSTDSTLMEGENVPLVFGPSDDLTSTKCKTVFCFDSCVSSLHLFLMQGVVNFFSNGAINAVSYFAFRCYGPLTYLLAINLGLIANPIAAFVAVFTSVSSNVAVGVLFAVSIVLSTVMLVLGFLGLTLHLPLLGSGGGSAIVVS